jgi:signal transduction histidine kinase
MKERVAFLKGKFELSSVIGEGTTITVTLPIDEGNINVLK